MTAAFRTNDFAAFELCTERETSRYGIRVLGENHAPQFLWRKSEHPRSSEFGHAWSLKLDLITAANHQCGELTIFRCYVSRDLQLDINLLTSGFATTLAHAIERTTRADKELLPTHESANLVAAPVG